MKYLTILFALIVALGLSACNEEKKATGDDSAASSDTMEKSAAGSDDGKTKAKAGSGSPSDGRYVSGP